MLIPLNAAQMTIRLYPTCEVALKIDLTHIPVFPKLESGQLSAARHALDFLGTAFEKFCHCANVQQAVRSCAAHFFSAFLALSSACRLQTWITLRANNVPCKALLLQSVPMRKLPFDGKRFQCVHTCNMRFFVSALLVQIFDSVKNLLNWRFDRVLNTA
jgi:hypothetical protein